MKPSETSIEASPQTRQTAHVQGIVGIGASAGGLDALESFLAHAPVTSGFAFVIVQHLDPQNEEGILAQRLAKNTVMPVAQVLEDTVVEANHVYIIAPGRTTRLQNGTLRLSKPQAAYGTQLPIDSFFRSMAKELEHRAIGIVLSGMGNDGALGLKEIKEHGGIACVQAPSSSTYTSMPPNALLEVSVDRAATAAELGRHLASEMARASRMDADIGRIFPAVDSGAVQRILSGLLDHTGHDFHGYKKNTIARRIQRRMTVIGIEKIDAYADFVDLNRSESDALFRDLLIGVTSFFRDANAFTCLEQKVIEPLVVSHRDRPGPLRIWVPGCSTGEEAYSIAMLFHEHASRHNRPADFQIFATDIDQSALEKARAGRYPASIAADVHAERLQKFFIGEKDSSTVQVGRQLRDSVVFAMQNVIKDPPFSRLDLICCRNLMIYFGVELQQMLLPILHYALNPGGYLFLGNSETLGVTQQQFRIVDEQWKVFQRQGSTFDAAPFMQRPMKTIPVASSLAHVQQPQRPSNLREITEQALLAEHTATAIVVNDQGDMLYVFGRTGKYLEQSTGEVTTNILRVARDGLRMRLATALHSVHVHQKPYQADGISIRHGDEVLYVRLSVSPITKPVPVQGLALVTLTEVPRPSFPDTTQDAPAGTIARDARLEELERELAATRDYLHTTIEQLEFANGGLSSANEDLQSSNEEMQSANEELQTSKEELQSINEELTTLNCELQNKITDLTNINNDIKNLLDNTQMGVIFLDTKLCIRRFTPAVAPIVNLIASDIGRPLEQFVCRLHYDRLFEDARAVLETQHPKEVEVQGTEGHWYLARILPYRTIDDKVDGVVLTFTNVTLLKDSKEKLEFLFDVLPVGISVIDRDRTSFKHNAAFLAMSDLSDDEYAHRRHFDRDYLRPDGTPRKMEEFAVSRVLAGEPAALHIESGFLCRDGSTKWVDVSAVPCPFADWKAIVVMSDITPRKETEMALLASEEKFSKAFHYAPLMIGIIDVDTRTIVECNQRFLEISGFARHEAIGTSTEVLGWVPSQTGARLLQRMTVSGYVQNEEIQCKTKDGRWIDCLYNGFIIEVRGKRQIVSMIQDISERKRREDDIKATLQREKETVLRELAHRTKNNMFVIRSMLKLHGMHTVNEEVLRLFKDIDDKIVAMALVHQKLYQSNHLSKLDLAEYMRELVAALIASHALNPDLVVVAVDVEAIAVLIDMAIPCGLVVTELVSNAFKHAFPKGRKGSITIGIRRAGEHKIHLEVRDDGIGVPENFDFRRRPTLGLETIFMIVEHQMKGTVHFQPLQPGLSCHIEVSDTLYSERV